MASSVIKTSFPVAGSPATFYFPDGAAHNVTDLRTFKYLFIVLTPIGNTQNRLDSKLIPVSTIDFSVTSNNAVWLNFRDTNGAHIYARLVIESPTRVSLSTIDPTENQVLLYGIK